MKKPTIFMMDLWATVPYYTAYLARALQAEGAPVQIGSISYYLDPTCFSSRGLRLDPGLLDVVGKYPLPRLPRRILKLVEAILNMLALTVRFLVSPPVIVHVQFLPMLRWRLPLDLWFLSLCRKRGSRLLLTVHDLLPHNTKDEHRQTFHNLYHRMDALICHSDHIKVRLQTEFSLSAERIHVIPHGPFFYDLPEELCLFSRKALDIPDDASIVLWQGILSPYKGLDVLLEAWHTVEAEETKGWLVIVGTGPPELLLEVREQARRLHLNRLTLHFAFVSPEQLVGAYRAADIVVYPYRAITTSGALATGLALGKTIIASDLPVFRELLTDTQDALLIPPANTQHLAGAILTLLRDNALRSRLAEAVRAMHFGERSWLSIASATIAVYQKLAEPLAMIRSIDHHGQD